jgi:peptidoglycan/xylan/chitin deacetylase (PgdA/CDA1 family)
MSRKIACLTLDMEPDYGDPDGHIRLLENLDYFERYTTIINKYNAKVTMFTVTSLFERFGERFRQLGRRIPLEYAAHSYSHDPLNAASRDEVEKSAQVMKRVNGGGPLGYRAPIGQITKEGLGYLLDSGYQYDASVYTSFRPGKFGYSNLHMPNIPFQITRGDESLLEFPFTSLSGVRIVFGLSYVKLLGWGVYSTLWRAFGLPDIALVLSHPHDFYFHELANFHVASLEKRALSRNAKRSFEYYEKMIVQLEQQGYEFMHVSGLFNYTHSQPDLFQIPLENWK